MFNKYDITFLQRKPAERGSGQISLKDIGHIDINKLAEQIEQLQQQPTQGNRDYSAAVDELSDGLKKLKSQFEENDLKKPKK